MKAKIAHKTLKLKQNFTLLLLVALVCSLMAFSITAIADAETPTAGDQPVALAEEAPEETPGDATEGMEINKTATYNKDTNDYTITLEAYATGEKVTTIERKEMPTDIILVLDQSGSMKNAMGGLAYAEYKGSSGSYNATNSNLYNKRHNGGSSNLYHKLSNGSYAEVSVIREQTIGYTKITSGCNNTSIYGSTNYWANRNNLWAKVNGEYVQVKVSWTFLSDTYTYSINNGETVIATSSGWNGNPTFADVDDGVLYLASTNYKYTYKYTDKAGNEHTIGTSTGESNTFEDPKLYYEYTDSETTKLKALESAATAFIENVAERSKGADGAAGTADDVNHRIAVVGFASTSSSYKNTELLSTSDVENYSNANDNKYKDALVSAVGTDGKVNPRLTTAIRRLDADGDTYLEYGMDMANKIFAQYPLETDEKGNAKRQRVVVVFTDGYPAPNGTDDFKYSMANNAIDKAYTSKNDCGATVYTIAVLNNADPTADITTNFAETDGWSDRGDGSNNLTTIQEQTAANRYLHYVSSNYLTVKSLTDTGALNPKADPFNNGASYYLVASDTTALNDIFQKISENIDSTGGSTTELSSSTVIKDIIAPQFQLPEGATAANITLETYACTGANTWTKNDTAMCATATIDGDNVDVTGFDFAENWCGTETNDGNITYRGNKLVIKFNVQTKDGFLGGNDVYTNTSAGVYENSTATEPVMTFNRPTVNVPIGAVTVTAADKNVYLLGSLTADEIKSGATASCGGVSLNLSAENYGLDEWQTAYVDITVTYTDASGNTITNLRDLEDDTTYTVAVTVAPKTDGSKTTEGTVATAKTGSATGNINVFKPVLTFKDSTVYYGDTAPTDYSGNKTGEVWKHEDKTSTDTGVTMTGTAPTLDLSYTPDSNGVKNGKIAVKTDIPVDVTVKIDTTDVTDKTKFNHTKCKDDEAAPTDGKFWLHVKTCSLTITKAAGIDTATNASVSFGTNESFVFNVKKDGVAYTQLTITGTGSVTISELPVGTYTVAEDTNWSWRYTPSYSGNPATLSSTNTSDTITCTNNLTTKQWLNGFSAIVKNVFGATSVQ